MPAMLREKQVIYFYLSSAQEQTTVPKIAKLAMFSLLTAASRRGKGEKNRVYVFVDEFQRVISDNISIFFEQARSMKLHFILANQTIGQLDRNGVRPHRRRRVVHGVQAELPGDRREEHQAAHRDLGRGALPLAPVDAAS